MADPPWTANAIATRQGLDGLREIIAEGPLRDVVQRVAALSHMPEGLRISLPDVRKAPTSWRDQEVANLIKSCDLCSG